MSAWFMDRYRGRRGLCGWIVRTVDVWYLKQCARVAQQIHRASTESDKAIMSTDRREAWDGEDGDDPDDWYCYRCDNQGVIIVCVDDLCRGAGKCMHGDGEMICPDCHGKNLL